MNFGCFSILVRIVKWSRICDTDSAAYMSIPSATEASKALSLGTNTDLKPVSLASRTIGRTPSIGRRVPFNESSPMKQQESRFSLI